MTDLAPHARAGLATLLLAVLPGASLADGWTEFHARCVTPIESLSAPLTEGLERLMQDVTTDRYALPDGGQLVVEHDPEDGISACAVTDPSGLAESGFDLWLGRQIAAGRYVPAGAETWLSHEWTEPVLALHKRRDRGILVLRMLETRLEA